MGLKLYGGARSRASMPRWYLEEKGLAYDWYRIGTKQEKAFYATERPPS